MAMGFGRGKQESSLDVLNPGTVHELTGAGRRRFSGALEITDKATEASAWLYMFEGGLYALALAGYTPPVIDRLVAAGALDSDQRRDIAVTLGAQNVHPDAGAQAVQHGWITAERLATVHQEYVLAGLGAVLACPRVKVKSYKGDSTTHFCTLPVQVEPLLDVLRMRAGRLAAGLGSIAPDRAPASICLENRQAPIPAELALAEFASFAAAVEPERSLDEVAHELGFTRAEAVHMAMLLVRAGVLRVTTEALSPVTAEFLMVPEAYGEGTLAVPAVAVPVDAMQWEVTGAGDDEGADASTSASWAAAVTAAALVDRASEPAVEPESEPVVEPESEPVSELVVEPVSENVTIPSPVTDEHVLLLRQEMVMSEVGELELLHGQMMDEEMAAISRAAAVRARLTAAQNTLEQLEADLRTGEGTRG
jgi:hypothetical protein